MSIINLAIPNETKTLLIAVGIRDIQDLRNLSIEEISEIIQLNKKNTIEMFKKILYKIENKNLRSAYEILQDEYKIFCCPIRCKAIRSLFHPYIGIPSGLITEISGIPGIGKTQLLMNLALEISLSKEYSVTKDDESLIGSVECDGCEVIYIDTEGNFFTSRLYEMFKNLIIIRKEENHDIEFSKILNRIYYYRIYDYLELIALINILYEFLENHDKVKLIIIDSIAFHFRYDFEDMSLRTRLLNSIAQQCNEMASFFKICIIMSNHVTTRFLNKSDGILVPALGASWGHFPNIRIMLYKENDEKKANIFKSSFIDRKIVSYKITSKGIQDI